MRLLPLLNSESGAPESAIKRIIATAPKRYKEYDIPKRTGGTRRIAHPAKELKELQRIVLQSILSKSIISPVASAYIEGRGILYNANIHRGQRWVLKLDFKDFFHSLTPADWDRAVRRTEALKHLSPDRLLFHQLLFWGRKTSTPQCLSIGAPTSPMVSNLICHKLDDWLYEKAKDRGLKVSRYADDITVSGSNVHQLLRFERDLENALEKNKGLRLDLNAKKRGLFGPGERRLVTGLVLTPTGDISIGRERKREIHALVHQYTLGNIDDQTAMRAKGLLAFAHSVEPRFVDRVRDKYGADLVKEIQTKEHQPNPEFLEVAFI